MSILIDNQDVSALPVGLRHHNAQITVVMILLPVHLAIKETTNAAVQTSKMEPVQLMMT